MAKFWANFQCCKIPNIDQIIWSHCFRLKKIAIKRQLLKEFLRRESLPNYISHNQRGGAGPVVWVRSFYFDDPSSVPVDMEVLFIINCTKKSRK